MEPGEARDRLRPWQQAALVAWPLVLAAVLVWPLLSAGGHPLARDLIFVPHQPLTDAALGLGGGSPRAVPLDAVMSLATVLADGAVWARVLLVVALTGAGWGVSAMLRSAGFAARVAASGFAVWNAFTVERLALGQWALLLAYAALPWVVMAAGRYRREGRARDLGVSLVAGGVASLTPTGGLLALAGLAAGGATRSWRFALMILGGLLLQLPWLVASLTGEAGRLSDPAGAAAFAPDTEAPTGAVVALLGLGGIWDSRAEPATRGTWVAVVAAAVTVLIVIIGWRALRAWWGRGELLRWALLAGTLAATAFVGATPLGRQVLEGLTQVVPGAGLLRDGQKFVAPAALLTAAALGGVVELLRARWAGWDPDVRRAALVPVLVMPFLLLPDATTVTWPTVEPVAYPAGFARVAEIVDEDGADITPVVVTLPWRSYRAFDWSPHSLTSSDPALRWLDAEVIVSDALQVGDTLVAGESARAAAVGAALARTMPARALPGLGVSWVLLYRDDPDSEDVDVTGLVRVFEDNDLELFSVPGAVQTPPPSAMRRGLVLGANLVALAVWLLAISVCVSSRNRVTPTPRPGVR